MLALTHISQLIRKHGSLAHIKGRRIVMGMPKGPKRRRVEFNQAAQFSAEGLVDGVILEQRIVLPKRWRMVGNDSAFASFLFQFQL